VSAREGTYKYGEPTVPVSKSRNQAQASPYVVGNKRSLMIDPQICLRLRLGTTPCVSSVFMDGGLDAQTIRLEGNIYSRTLGGSGIIVSYAGPECTGVCTEEPFSRQLSSVKARFPRRGAAVLAGELAGLPWSAIDLSGLKLHAAGKGSARKPDSVLPLFGWKGPVNVPQGFTWGLWISAGLAIPILAELKRHRTSQEDS
jgi:hypothetical protein